MNFVDSLDKRELLVKYGKYVAIIVVLLVVFIVLKGCSGGYNKTEKALVAAAEDYVSKNNVSINGTTYIDVSKLGEIEGTEMCKKSSGVLVTYEGGKVVYKPYLKCDNYESDVINNNNGYITLNGSEIVFLNKNEIYEEKYYKVKDNTRVTIGGTVGDALGVYTLTYYAYVNNTLKGTATRVVIRTNVDTDATVSGVTNTILPTITLRGDSEVLLRVGEKYREAGWDAVDYKDGKISRAVQVTPSKVDTSRTGEFYITYSVTNSRGYKAEVRRKVTVANQVSNLDIKISYEKDDFHKEISIYVNITGSGYSHMVLPNGKVTHSANEIYKATYNNGFVFTIYDIYGNSITKTVNINNIDSVLPRGTCEAKVAKLSKRTSITVNAQDNKGISGYNYIINGKPSGYITENTFDQDIAANRVAVVVKDIVGNEATIDCTIKTVLTTVGIIGENGITEIFKDKPSLNIPIADALKAKGYTVDDLNACIGEAVLANGPGTRNGVVASAYSLLSCMYELTGMVISYEHFGGLVTGEYCSQNESICGKIGVNTRWGEPGGACKKGACHYGLNCATFVRWALCNGGMDLCSRGTNVASTMAAAEYFPGAEIVVVKGSGEADARRLKPGDVIEIDGRDPNQHVAVVIGKDDTGIYTANDGYYTEKIEYSWFSGGKEFWLLLLDGYYANPSNQHNLYK